MSERVWEVFHGKNLDQLVDRAHTEAPLGFQIEHNMLKLLLCMASMWLRLSRAVKGAISYVTKQENGS